MPDVLACHSGLTNSTALRIANLYRKGTDAEPPADRPRQTRPIGLFDAHHRNRDATGKPECLDPETMEYPKGWPLSQDDYGTWRTTKPFTPFGV